MIETNRRTKIVATVGPATFDEERLKSLLQAGVDVVRINCSHGNHEQHRQIAQTVKGLSEELNRPFAILWDLQGPRLRIKQLHQPIYLSEGSEVILAEEIRSEVGVLTLPVEAPYLATAIRQGQRILIDDGNIELEALQTDGVQVRCRVIRGGSVKSYKGINIPGAKLAVPILSEEDLRDLRNGIQSGADFIALSFVRSADDIEMLRTAIQAHGVNVPIIAKLERSEAIENLEEILRVADGVMVARGDLGVELPSEEVPIVQKHIITKANQNFVPVITATQMLESMIESPRPTRAEASDVANATLDGSDALMLSGETSIGKYPLESVKMMHLIICSAEKHAPKQDLNFIWKGELETGIAHAISDASCLAASEIKAKAIVVFTQSGSTALFISKRRPTTPIVAFTPDEKVQRQLNLLWGVIPKCFPFVDNTDELIKLMDQRLESDRIAQKGDLVVIVAGIPLSSKGRANFLKVHTVGTSYNINFQELR